MFDRLRAESPVYKVPGREEFLVTRHEDLTFVTSHSEIFSSYPADAPWSPGWSETMIAKDPPDHTPLRKLIYRSFTPAKIRGLEPIVREVVDGLIDGFIDHGEMEFVTAFANPLSLLVTCRLLGLPREDASWLEHLVGTFEAQAVRYHPIERQERQEANGAKLVEYLRAKVLEKLERPGDDVLSEVIANHTEASGGAPNIEYLAVEANVLLAGGITTTAHMAASAMSLLLRHPDQMELVQNDFSLIPRMVEEVIRLESPAQYQPRYAVVDTELGGVKIPRGSCLLILYSAANRDPERFSCPADFDVRRTNVEKHVGFGHGPHFCIGAPISRLEGRISFEQLFTRLKDIRLAEGKNDFKHSPSLYFRAPSSLQLWFERA
jgi:cytochrome P450